VSRIAKFEPIEALTIFAYVPSIYLRQGDKMVILMHGNLTTDADRLGTDSFVLW
jgi:hypothetical protein